MNQVTFLHVYHHSSVVALALLYVRYTFCEQVPILVFLNSFVHVFMYAYYFLAALGPEMQKRLWWKKYITAMQLIQFVILLLSMAGALVLGCEGNKLTMCSTMAYVSYFLYLFGKFYQRTYNTKKSGPETAKSEEAIKKGA